jgi:hypothetical protein
MNWHVNIVLCKICCIKWANIMVKRLTILMDLVYYGK